MKVDTYQRRNTHCHKCKRFFVIDEGNGNNCPYCEIDRLKEELEEAKYDRKMALIDEQHLVDAEIEINDLKRQLAEVTAKYNDVCTIERVDLLKQQLAEARAENERLKDKLSDAYDDHCDSH